MTRRTWLQSQANTQMSEGVHRLVNKKLEWWPGNSKAEAGMQASNSIELNTVSDSRANKKIIIELLSARVMGFQNGIKEIWKTRTS